MYRTTYCVLITVAFALASPCQTGAMFHEAVSDRVLPEVAFAVDNINTGRRDLGIGQLESILREHPNQRQALESLTEAYLQENRRAEAGDLAGRCVKKHSASYRCRTLQGRVFLDNDNAAAAEAILKKAVDLNDADPEANMYLGIARARLNKLERAEADLNRALAYRRRGRLSTVLLHLAGLYDKLKQPFQAASYLEKFLKEQPSAANADQIRFRISEFRAAK